MICTLLTFFCFAWQISPSLSACDQAAVSVSFGSPNASFLRGVLKEATERQIILPIMPQNSPFRCQKSKKFPGRGHSPLPRPTPGGEGDTPSPYPTPLGAFGASILPFVQWQILLILGPARIHAVYATSGSQPLSINQSINQVYSRQSPKYNSITVEL